MKILFFAAGTEILASSRTRVYHYLPYLAKEGIKFKVINFVSDNACKVNMMRLKEGPVKIALGKIYSLFQTLKFLFFAGGYDIIFVQKVVLPKTVQVILRFLNRHIIFDFDDALFISNKDHKFTNRFVNMISKSKYIILENDFTKSFVQKYNKNILMITGPIDTNRYALRQDIKNNGYLTIGWIGSQDTVEYLLPLYEVFRALGLKYKNLIIEIVGARKFNIDGVRLITKDWSLDTEIVDLYDFDIGIMPLPDDDWSRGKGGYKLLQYMAIGIPCVASPIGINREIIREGINGYFARTQKEWEEKLSKIIEDRNLRISMGLKGREIAIKEYSFESYIGSFIRALKQASG